MIFVGIDPGLTAPAVCSMDEQGEILSLQTIRTGKLRGMARWDAIVRATRSQTTAIVTLADDQVEIGPTSYLVAIEGHSYGHNQRGSRERVEIGGVIKWDLSMRGVPWTQDIPPSTLRKYIAGHASSRGAEGKRQMIQAAADAGVEVIDDNQADAWGLAVILRDAYLLATKGVQPSTLYRYEVCDGLRPWIEEQIERGV